MRSQATHSRSARIKAALPPAPIVVEKGLSIESLAKITAALAVDL
jgi:hypothetical protein